jgi:DNA polymerase-1
MSKIKECFISRFKGGALYEIDYSQLEVIGLAILSKDPQLKDDLKSGIDMHCMNAANMFGNSYNAVHHCVNDDTHHDHAKWKEKRQIAKVFSFQLQYGSGAKNMAADQGVSVKIAEKFIAEYYDRYPEVKKWQESNIATVKLCHEPTGKKSALGFPVNKGYLESPTGRRYEFTEYDSPEFMKDRGIHTSFSPTQIKNYPVQGFSTGDVVPLAIGEMMKYLYMNELEDKILLINTIHDSVIIDTQPKEYLMLDDDLDEHLWNLCHIMVSIGKSINNLWPDVDFDLPLNVDVKRGIDWGHMKPYTIGYR